MPIHDLTGRRFGKLVVLCRAENRGHMTYWKCLCDCGNEKVVQAASLVGGKTVTCGCRLKTHGGTGTRLYAIWCNMLNRCRNPNVKSYKTYGALGISVCDEWQESFAAFRDWSSQNGYRDDLTIDRRDNSLSYCPENCRWITKGAQALNKKTTHLSPSGEAWCQIALSNGIRYNTFSSRLGKGWSPERAATTPLSESRHARPATAAASGCTSSV